MATHSSDCTREGCHYASSGGASGWTSSSKFYSGKDGTWYRSRVTFKTGSFVGVSQSSKRFVMQLTIDSTASPCGCMATLTTKSLVPGKIMSDDMTGPHADLTSGCIGQSYAYADSAASSYSTGTNKSSGYTFYFSFSSASIQPNTTYYVYCHYKSGRGSSTGWTRCNASALSAWVEYTPNWRLTLSTSTGVSSFTGGGDYAHSTSPATTATASTGYHLTQYVGTVWNADTNATYTDCADLTTHSTTWGMYRNRTITVYAAKNSHTLTINPNGGTWGGKTSNSTFTKEYASTTYIEDPTRSGYRFAGWTWSSDVGFTLQDHALGFPIERSNSTAVGYAVPDNYSRYTFTASNPSGNTWHWTRLAAYSVSANEKVTITGQVRIASNSAGLAANFYHGATTNDYGNCLLSISSTNSEWQDFSFERTFTAAGTSYLEVYTSDQKGKSGTMVVDLRCIKISRSAAGEVPSSVTMPNGWVTLIAQWVPVYTITCTSPKEGTRTYTKTQDTPLQLPSVSRDNTTTEFKVRLYYNDDSTGYIDTYATKYTDYVFDGWYESGVGYVSNNKFTANRAATLTAYFLDEGYTEEVPLVDYIPDRIGYTFDCWCLDDLSSDIVIYDSYFVPEQDTSLYIRWIINSHEFNIYDYYKYDYSYYDYGTAITLPAITDSSYEEWWDELPIEFFHASGPDDDNLLETQYASVHNVFAPTGVYEIRYYDGREDIDVVQHLRPGDTFVMPDYPVECVALYDSSHFSLCFWSCNWNWFSANPEIPQYDLDGNSLQYQKFKHWLSSGSHSALPNTLPNSSYITLQLTTDQVDSIDFSTPAQYYSVFNINSAVLAYYKASGAYKLGLPFVNNNGYQNANAFWIKADDRWMTLAEYKDTQE